MTLNTLFPNINWLFSNAPKRSFLKMCLNSYGEPFGLSLRAGIMIEPSSTVNYTKSLMNGELLSVLFLWSLETWAILQELELALLEMLQQEKIFSMESILLMLKERMLLLVLEHLNKLLSLVLKDGQKHMVFLKKREGKSFHLWRRRCQKLGLN